MRSPGHAPSLRLRAVWRCVPALLAVTCLPSATDGLAQDASTITLHYNQRVPYAYAEDGVVKGLLATPVSHAFDRAAVPYQWAATPMARQLDRIKSNRGLDCLAGRFKTSDRLQWARYSHAIYRDRPQGLLVRSNDAHVKALPTLAAALRAPTVKLLVKSGYYYGPVIDDFISQRAQPPLKTFDENHDMLRQVHRKMADAFVIAPEEADALLAHTPLPRQDFAFLTFPDAPQGELRYIMCSHNVPLSTMEQLNAAIDFHDASITSQPSPTVRK